MKRNEVDLISVIVPVYNGERDLPKCIDSILNQTYPYVEIILVDDGSTDNTGKICDEYNKLFENIKVIHQSNKGISAARNAGLDIAKGEYIGFVDSDDWIEPEMYQVLYIRAIEEEAQISCCGTNIIQFDGQKINRNESLDEKFTLDRFEAAFELLKNEKIDNSMWNKLYHRDIFKKGKEQFNVRMIEGMIFEDLEAQPRCIFNANRITYTAKPLYNYFLSENSILRSDITLTQYDVAKASEIRVGFYSNHYKKYIVDVKVAHLVICLDLLVKVYGNTAWKHKINEIYEKIDETWNDIKYQCSDVRVRIKVLLFIISPRVYVFFIRLYRHIRYKRFTCRS